MIAVRIVFVPAVVSSFVEKEFPEYVEPLTAVETEETDIETAKAKGAMALFGEKYGDDVRVLTMGGGFSVELCGGTHVSRTGDIGLFKITSEGGVAAGVRRIEGVTGAAALAWLNGAEEQLKEAAALVKGSRDNVLDKLSGLIERNRQLEKELEQLKAKAASAAGNDLAGSAVEVKGVKVLAARLDGLDGKALLAMVDQLKNKLGSAVILLGGVFEDKVVLVAGVTQDLTAKLNALLGSRGGDWEILTTSAFVTIIVPLIVFFSLQRYFVRGLLAGSVKGG